MRSLFAILVLLSLASTAEAKRMASFVYVVDSPAYVELREPVQATPATASTGFIPRQIDAARDRAMAKAGLDWDLIRDLVEKTRRVNEALSARHSLAPATTGNAEPVAVEVKPVAQVVAVNQRLRVLFFTCNNCGWCGVAKRKLEAKGCKIELSHDADYVLVNVDEARNEKLKDYYRPKSFPTFVIVDAEGKEKWRGVGANAANNLPDVLESHRLKAETKSVLKSSACPNPYCQCANCTCNPCRCGVYAASPMPAMGCSTCGVSYRRGWRR